MARKAATNLRAKNLYDRKSSWQVKIKCLDGKGVLHSINRSFTYDPAAHPDALHGRRTVFREAEAFAAAERVALAVGKVRRGDDLDSQTLAGWLERHLEDSRRRQKASIRTDKRAVRVLLKDFPDLCSRPVTSLSTGDFLGNSPNSVEFQLLYGPNKASTTYAKKLLRHISSVFNSARRDWGFDIDNPLKGHKLPPDAPHRDRIVSPEEWDRILADLKKHADRANRVWIELLRWTACRSGEIWNLQWSDITWSTNPPTAHLRKTKSSRRHHIESRSIPLLPEAVAALQELFDGEEPPTSGYVITINGRRPYRNSVSQTWPRACKRLGIEGATLHDLRHTRTTELAQLLSMADLAKVTGHSSMSTLLRYYNPTAEQIGQKVLKAESAAQTAPGSRRTRRPT